MRVRYRVFKSLMKSWDDLCAEAAAFASGVSKDRLISIAMSADGGQGVICVWYWE
jgi:hypothetical protein